MAQSVDQIISMLNEVASLYQRLQQNRSAGGADRLGKLAGALRDTFEEIEKNAKNLESIGTKRQKALDVIEGVLEVKDALGLQKFFENVSTSLIEAQKDLNKQSLDYIKHTQNRSPRLPPAYYTIPSVKAEMKVGFSQISQRGVNLVLFTNKDQRDNYGESTISFELVSAPPPPGPTLFGDYVVPVPRFIVLGEKRENILRFAQHRSPILKNQLQFASLQHEAVVLQYEHGKDASPSYLVLWPARTANSNPDQWSKFAILKVEEPKEDSFELKTDIFKTLTFTPESSTATMPSNHLLIRDKTLHDSPLLNLGNAMMQLVLLLNGWLKAVKVEPPASQAPPTDG